MIMEKVQVIYRSQTLAFFILVLVICIPVSSSSQTINSLNPSSGGINTPITLVGSAFGASQDVRTVRFNGVVANVVNWSDTAIVANVPTSLALGNVTVVVQNQRGFGSSNGVTFTVTPGVTQISPSIGPVGTPLVITGTLFGASQGSSTVTIGAVSVVPTSWSDTSISAAVPAGLPSGSSNVIVSVGGFASSAQSITVIPVITGESPSSGPVGAQITLTGTSFGSQQGGSTLTFNGMAATPTTWGDTSVTVPVPLQASSGPIVATINGIASNGAGFLVAPKINNATPAVGMVNSAVTISGTTFGSTPGFGGVTFNGVSASVQNWSDSSITVLVPPDATSGNIVVTDHQL